MEGIRSGEETPPCYIDVCQSDITIIMRTVFNNSNSASVDFRFQSAILAAFVYALYIGFVAGKSGTF